MTESRSLGEAIRLRRLELGMSQEELAERIAPDMRQSDVSRLERGKILFPRRERLSQIASALGVSVGVLLIEAGWLTDDESQHVAVSAPANAGTGISVLIADDEPVSLAAIASLLADSGYSAATAYDLATLLQAFHEARPEIVIVDIALPGLNPNRFVRRFASLDPKPMIVFMGSGLPEVEVDGPYLEKPIDSRQLLTFVNMIEAGRVAVPRAMNGDDHHVESAESLT